VKASNGLSTTLNQRSIETTADGAFHLDGIVPGFNYNLDFVMSDAEGNPKGWRQVTQVKLDAPKQVELGDVKYVPPPVPKRWDEYAADAFKVKDPLNERLEKTRRIGRFCYQRPMVVFGGPGRPTAKMLGKVRYDYEDRSNEEAEKALMEFVTMSIDLDATGNDAKALAERLKVSWPVKETALVVLGEDGSPLAQVSGEELSSGGKPDVAKFTAWAKQYALPKPDAKKLLEDALAKAKAENKRVLVDETSAYCGWCVKLGEYLESNGELLSKEYVTVTLDRRLPNGQDVLGRLRPKKEYSTPWMVILDADGKPLIDSDAPTGNIGFPGEPDSQEHWAKMIRSTARHLTEADVDRLLKPLRP
jgi:hypothetical protein